MNTSLVSFPWSARPSLVHTASHWTKTSMKTDSLWNRFLEWIGAWIRDTFFMPIPAFPSLEIKRALQREENFVADFWNPSKPLDPNYPQQEIIRNTFHVYDQPIQMKMPDGKLLEFTCRVIESKNPSKEAFFHSVHVLGSGSTLKNNIASTYPFIAAYLEARKKDPTLPAARFILISQYALKKEGVPFRPKSLDEAGWILKNAIETLSEKMGPIDQVVAESLGSIIFASSLKYFEADSKATPPCIHLDRAPSSIAAASSNYFGGSLLSLLLSPSGWSLDIGQELGNFYKKHPATSCIVSGVKNDFYFPGHASLHEDEKIKELPQVTRLVFAPPRQLFHVRAHHGLRSDFLNGNYLVETTDRQLLRPQDNLATASFRLFSRRATKLTA